MSASLFGLGQEAAPSASLQGTIRDANGKPVAQVAVVLQKRGTADRFTAQTDSRGSYRFANLRDGLYSLQASKDGRGDATLDSLFLGPHQSKTVDLALGTPRPGNASEASAPQFFDPPQFTVAGVTDTTNLGGHGSDMVVRTRDSLAKETVSLGETKTKDASDAAEEKSLREAAESHPDDFEANHRWGHWLIASGRAREAIPFLQRAATETPTNYENAYDLVAANADAGKNEIARADAQSLLAGHDSADVHHLLADISEKLGDSLEAVRHYQRAAELDPSEPHLFDWGAELLLHHAPEPAQEVFSRGTQKYPHSARMLLGLGAASFAGGNSEDAVRSICQASDLNPRDPTPYLFLGKIEKAEILPSDDVIDRFRRFVVLQPQNADADYYYAVGLWKQRNRSRMPDVGEQVQTLLKTRCRSIRDTRRPSSSSVSSRRKRAPTLRPYRITRKRSKPIPNWKKRTTAWRRLIGSRGNPTKPGTNFAFTGSWRKNRRRGRIASAARSSNSSTPSATSPRPRLIKAGRSLVCNRRQCIIAPRGFCGKETSPTQPLRGTMSEIREDNSASRVATYFVFAFLLAAIIETMIATVYR